MVDLGTLGGCCVTEAVAVSDSGQVVGNSPSPSGEMHAFSWTQAGGMVDLGTLGGCCVTEAVAVSDSGQVVGNSPSPSGEMHAFSWTQAGGMVDLGTLGGCCVTEAVAVSDSGQVVGNSPSPSGEMHAFSWTQAGGMVDVGGLGDWGSQAVGVSDSGQVVGNSFISDPFYAGALIDAFSWTLVVPGAPSGVVAAAGDGSAAVSWLASPLSASYAVTPHDLTTNSDGAVFDVSGTSATVDGLTNGHSYTFTVTATNSAGTSSPSTPSNAATPQAGNPPPATATGTAFPSSTTTVSTGTTAPPGGTATSVEVPAGTAGGTVSIAVTGTTEPAPSGFSFLGQQVNITAPDATAANPLVFVFQIDASLLPAGVDVTTISVFRNGSLVADCDIEVTGASPDPCVASRVTLGSGAAELTVRTSEASHWNFGKGGFTIAGLFQPVDNLPVLNSVKAGNAIPVKFSLGANQGLNIFTSGYPRSAQTACDSSAPIDPVELTVNAGGSSLSYDAKTSQYTYVWKTDKAWSAASGGPCRQLVLAFVDGSFLRANFKFK